MIKTLDLSPLAGLGNLNQSSLCPNETFQDQKTPQARDSAPQQRD